MINIHKSIKSLEAYNRKAGNHMNKSNHRNSFSADQVGYFGKPFYIQEALEIEVARNKKIQELGIIEHHFGSGVKYIYTDDEKEALRLIYADKEVPQKLADRIKEYHKKNDKYKKKLLRKEKQSNV